MRQRIVMARQVWGRNEYWLCALAAGAAAAGVLTPQLFSISEQLAWIALFLLVGLTLLLGALLLSFRVTVLLLASLTVFVPYIDTSWPLTPDDVLPLTATLLGSAFFLARGKIPKTWLIWPFMLWTLAGLLSAIVNAQDAADAAALLFRGSFRPFQYLMMVLLVLKFAPARPQAKMLLNWIVWVGFAEALFGLGAYALDFHGPWGLGLETTQRSYSLLYGKIPGRVSGTLGEIGGSNMAASFYLLLSPVAGALWLKAQTRRQRLFYFGAAGALVLATLLTYTRSSIIATLAAWMLLFLLIRGKRRQTVLIYVVLGGVLALKYAPLLLERLTGDYQTDRFALWYAAGRIFADHILLGIGTGNYIQVLNANSRYYETPFGTARFTAHNIFLQAGVSSGLVAVLALLLILAVIFYNVWQAYRQVQEPDTRFCLAGILAGMFGFMLQCQTNNLLFIPAVATYFWMLYAIAIRLKADETLASPACL